jgi:hypothetical protein
MRSIETAKELQDMRVFDPNGLKYSDAGYGFYEMAVKVVNT